MNTELQMALLHLALTQSVQRDRWARRRRVARGDNKQRQVMRQIMRQVAASNADRQNKVERKLREAGYTWRDYELKRVPIWTANAVIDEVFGKGSGYPVNSAEQAA